MTPFRTTNETVYEQPFSETSSTRSSRPSKSNMKVDWTEPHRDDVRAAIRTAVRRVLRRRDVKAEDLSLHEKFMAQAEALYAELRWRHEAYDDSRLAVGSEPKC